MKAIIDADLLVYRCGFAAQKTRYKLFFHVDGSDEEYCKEFDYKKDLNEYVKKGKLSDVVIEKYTEYEPLENALSNVKNVLENILTNLSTDNYVLYLTGEGNFREDIATLRKYKGNRDKNHKPKYYDEIREYLVTYWKANVIDGQEADDAVAIEMCQNPEPCCIVSTDKDLDMIPGPHYNWVKGEYYEVSEDEATRCFCMQLLTGDSTDNIVGIPKIGPKTAEKLLKDCTDLDSMMAVVKEQYEKAYGEEAEKYLLENGRLLWMRTDDGEMWEPEDLENTNGNTT